MGKCRNNCGMTFVPAFFDFKCPKCGTPCEMTDKEKYDNQQLCDLTMEMAKKMNGIEEDKDDV